MRRSARSVHTSGACEPRALSIFVKMERLLVREYLNADRRTRCVDVGAPIL